MPGFMLMWVLDNDRQRWLDHAWSTNLLPRRTSFPPQFILNERPSSTNLTDRLGRRRCTERCSNLPLQKLKRAAAQRRLCPSARASESMRKRKKKRVFTFNTDHLVSTATYNERQKSQFRNNDEEKIMLDVCSLVGLDAQPSRTNTEPPHTHSS